MRYTDWSQEKIRDIVTTLPVAAQLFREHGIDFCCEGDKVLEEAVNKLEITQKELYIALDEMREKRADYSDNAPEFLSMTPRELAIHIKSAHHAAFWEELPKTRALLIAALRAQGKDHPELYDVYKLFGELSKELEPHLIREETEFMPLIGDEDACCKERCAMLKRVMAEDHRKLTAVMKEIRHATNGFSVPADATDVRGRLYEHLMDLEGELYQYIHLENNILFHKLG